MAQAQRAEVIKGTLVQISQAYRGGWRRAKVHPHGTVTGILPELKPGDICAFKGTWKNKPPYGDQFEATEVKVEIPKDTAGIMGYLSRHFKFVGPILAGKLVKAFGTELFKIMESEPQKLTTVTGITPERAAEIGKEYQMIMKEQAHDVFFATNGISLNLAGKLADHYGSKQAAIEAVKENPYQLADEVWGIGFKKSDAVAISIGVKPESPMRIKAGLRYVLKESGEGAGHCFLPTGELEQKAKEILQTGDANIQEQIKAAVKDGRLSDYGGLIYDPGILYCENLVSNRLKFLATRKFKIDPEELSEQILAEMDEDQRRAVDLALSSQVCVVTGGPGVGKTFTIKRILQALQSIEGYIIGLAAPTGKAAKRMFEMTGKQASTIHRLLEYNPFSGGFTRNHDNPLEFDTLIIDETSMLDIRLMASLLDAVSDSTQIIFVGDVDQLPSVGPGRVLADMIDSGVIPVSRLRTLHRQAAASLINRNAQSINAGGKIVVGKDQKADFWFIPQEDSNAIPAVLLKVIEKIPQHFGFEMRDIQILCPQKRGPVGTKNLNEFLRPILNPAGQKVHGYPFLTGDRVIQLKNNYKLDVFNGDIGHVVDGGNGILLVEFEEAGGIRKVEYSSEHSEQLALAYALTVHKSQGSEFPVVIMPMHTCNYLMLKRNLLYTGITRGKKLVMLVGNMKAVNTAIRTVDGNQRYTNLKKFLQEG